LNTEDWALPSPILAAEASASTRARISCVSRDDSLDSHLALFSGCCDDDEESPLLCKIQNVTECQFDFSDSKVHLQSVTGRHTNESQKMSRRNPKKKYDDDPAKG